MALTRVVPGEQWGGPDPMHVLIVGGTGLISTSLSRQLRTEGATVTVFNRARTANRTGGTLRQITGDRRDYRAFKEAVRAGGPWDAIVDMICFTSDDAWSLVEAARGVTQQVVFCSTVDVYRKTGGDDPIREDVPQAGMTQYARDKVECERILRQAAEGGAFRLTIGRPAYSYGEGGGVLHVFGWGTWFLDRLRRGRPVIVSGDATQPWTSTHVDDVAAGFAAMVGNPAAFDRAYNLTGDEPLSWARYHEEVAGAAGGPAPRLVGIPGEVLWQALPEAAALNRWNFQHGSLYSNAAAKRDLGWRPRVSFAQGMRRTVAWLDAQKRIEPWETAAWVDGVIEAWERVMAGFVAEVRSSVPGR